MKALMYHYVRESNEDLPYFRYLHIEDFKLQLNHLSKDYYFPTKEEFYKSIQTGEPIENSIILTFDDGLKDHLDVTKELLDRNMFGIFYVATGPYKTGKLLDVHRTHLLIGKFGGVKILDALMSKIDETMLEHNKVEEFHTLTYARQENDQATEKCKRLLNYLLSCDQRQMFLSELMQEFLDDEREICNSFYLNNEEMRYMHDNGMVIGSHSVSHPVFSKLSKADQEQEIKESFSYLESVLGDLGTKSFCYPYGGFHNFSKTTEKIVSEEGCLYSFNVEQRDIESNDLKNRPQALPRYDCNQFDFGQASMGTKRPSELNSQPKSIFRA